MINMFHWFSFKKKDDLIERYSLRQIPLFATLTENELTTISKRAEIKEFRKGDVIYRQGDSVAAFYVIISGRCRVFVGSPSLNERTLAYLHKGDYFGEVSLLTEKTHAANIEAINHSLVLEISKNDFFDLIRAIPSISFQISRRLGLRIKKLYEPSAFKSNTKIISLLQLGSQEQNSLFSLNFAASLRKETLNEVLLIDIGFILKNTSMRIDDSVPIVPCESMGTLSLQTAREFIHTHQGGFDLLSIPSDIIDYFDIKVLNTFLTDLLTAYKYVIINVIPSYNNEVMPFVEQSDIVYVVGDSEARSLQRSRRVIKKVHSHYNLTQAELRLILYEAIDKKRMSITQKEKVTEWKIFSLIPYYRISSPEKKAQCFPVLTDPREPFSCTVRYLARELAGILVGLALGSGAAFGLAHIGVLKALERENIHIDIVSGCSIGAVIGALWASGYSAVELENIAFSFKRKRDLLKLVDIFDLSFPFSGFCKGRTVKHFLHKYLKKTHFKHLRFPLRIVATDLFTSEDVVFKEGNVIDAIRASISIPGVIRPFKHGGKMLIDGGVTNPLPISLLIDEGVRKIIAVNVLPSSTDLLESQECRRLQDELKEARLRKKNVIKKFFIRLRQAHIRFYTGNIVNVLMNTIQYLESTVSSKQYSDADIVIHPSVCGSRWFEFYEPEKFITCGEVSTLEVMSHIKKLTCEEQNHAT